MSITKSGAIETAIEYLMSSSDTRYMGVAVRDAILKLEAAQQVAQATGGTRCPDTGFDVHECSCSVCVATFPANR